MNPLLKPCFVQYCSRKVVNLIKENFVGNAKRISRYFDRYEISYRSSIVDRIEIRLDFAQPWVRAKSFILNEIFFLSRSTFYSSVLFALIINLLSFAF